MSFHHLAGVTTPAAPDEVVDWFSSFEAWIVTVGWTIASGSGTTNLVISSAGEAGGLTKLFIHIWRVGVGNTVRMEVSDDAIPTHETSEAGTLDSGGVQFEWWMSGDKDAIVIVWKLAGGYRALYAGLVMPFAMTLPDETYCMIATSTNNKASILRQHTGVWDVDINMYDTAMANIVEPSQFDGSFPIMGLCANRRVDLAGQLHHVSSHINSGAVNPEDTLQTGYPGATTTWVILMDSDNHKFALRTGGVLPTGVPDGAHFAHQSGVTTSLAHWHGTVLVNFLTAIGWTDLGDPGGPHTFNRLFHSAGESGTEDIYVLFTWNVNGQGYLHLYIQDDAVGTHRTGTTITRFEILDFPGNYWITADRDCVLCVIQYGIMFNFGWGGMVEPFNPNLPSTPYKMGAAGSAYAGYVLLRGADGAWTSSGWLHEEVGLGLTSNNNAFDGTYIVWPSALSEPLGGARFDAFGMMKYLMYTDGGGIANLDTIQVGAQTYTVFWDGINFWAMRTV